MTYDHWKTRSDLDDRDHYDPENMEAPEEAEGEYMTEPTAEEIVAEFESRMHPRVVGIMADCADLRILIASWRERGAEMQETADLMDEVPSFDDINLMINSSRAEALDECLSIAAMIEGSGGKVTQAIAQLRKVDEYR